MSGPRSHFPEPAFTVRQRYFTLLSATMGTCGLVFSNREIKPGINREMSDFPGFINTVLAIRDLQIVKNRIFD
jgi:hypothetical protein